MLGKCSILRANRKILYNMIFFKLTLVYNVLLRGALVPAGAGPGSAVLNGSDTARRV